MEKKAIQDELKKVRESISELKSNFSKKGQEKEDNFSKGEGYSNQIKELYDKVKKIEVDSDLDKINEDLELRKVEYDKYKKSLEELELRFAEMKKNFKPSFDGKKSGRQKPKGMSIDKAKSEIKKLELKLQTHVLSLDKESVLIKEISTYKHLVDDIVPEIEISNSESKPVSDDHDEFTKLKKEVNSIRRKFILSEKKIRSFYKQIRIISRNKKEIYKEIDKLRDLKKASFESFRSDKTQYLEINKKLRDLFKKESECLVGLGKSPKENRRSESQIDFKAKQKEVEEKLMKKGGVLTTEDLLMFQKR